MSLAPERIGIGIHRHFTSPGVHPYDELVWELRDARISNYRDGSVAFEQLGVEFPVTWSLNATNIVAQKYFRGTLGTQEREHSLRQVIDRVADTISDWGIAGGYFLDDAEADAFRDELKHLLVHQKAAFNSPVWFNIGVKGVPQQASACFILAVDDSMDSILNWYREEGIIFKGGSGSGVNLSRIRSSFELLKGGGTASGPVSFMRGADASAGTIKSGGKTRRAAKMVILNADHPDVEEFIWCKAKEERKARVLRDAGFDMDLDGSDSFSIQYQNANNSVRVTDEFMDAVEADADWELRAVLSDEVIRRVPARQLFRDIARAAWECADPGLQFDTTINRWHTAATTGRINGSNPCFTGDSYVHTDKGLVQFVELVDRVRLGETFGVYTHDATNPDAPGERVEITSPDAVMITGFNEIVRLEFSNGMEVRCTAGHRLFTANRGYVRADELTATDEIRVLDQQAPAVAAEWRLPVPADVDAYVSGDRRQFTGIELPEKWSDELAHYLGWLVGDGCVGGDTATSVYGGPEEVAEILPAHQALLAALNGGAAPKPSIQANGTQQLRSTRRAVARFVDALGVSSAKASDKVLPWSIEQAPPEIAAAFLRGLFDADGCVFDGAKSRYVGLGSSSRALLQGVQRLLTTMGVFSSIYATRHATADEGAFSYVRKDGSVAIYDAKPMFDLRISSRSIARFAEAIGFSLPSKRERLTALVAEHRFNATRDQSVRLVGRSDDGVELTYNLSEPRNHSYVVNGILVANCSEYVHLDNSACNLASLNLLKFLRDDDTFDVEGFKAGVEVVFTAQEILVGNADYPTPGIADTTRKFRQLGLGYANLGALLMALGQPYDSDEGRALAAAITSLMTGHAYATSARIAGRMGPFAGFADNEEHMLRVLNMHRDAASCIDEELVPTAVLSAAQLAWDDAVAGGEEFGVRNSQASVLAPTGCLVGGTLVATDRGLRRLATLGNVDGAEWQDVSFRVLTDDGEQDATKFYVNGLETVVDVTTERGYRIQGTPQHRVKVVDEHGAWAWRRFAELRPGDRVPLALDQLVGEPQVVTLPPLTETMGWAGEHHLVTPATVTPELAELVGMFMGDGSLHARGLRFRVADADFDVVAHLERLAKELFGIQVVVTVDDGHQQVAMNSVRLAEWWRACGFAKHARATGPAGDGDVPHVPEAVLAANDRATYAAFLRGLFEAEGTVTAGYPTWTTTAASFKHDVQGLMLALGYVTSTKHDVSRRGSALLVLRLLNRTMNERWLSEIGFVSARKAAKVDTSDLEQSWRHDHVPVSRALLERVAPDHEVALKEFRRSGTITRRLALELLECSGDAELAQLTGYFYDRVVRAELGDEQLTYDLSVPSNVTYLANGFVSHNTIGLMMDCDTTGIEPDLGLVKFKKLVGGGSMSIVNQTVPRALRRLGYNAQQIDEIVGHIDEHKTIVGAPHLRAEHLAVFACSMGDNTIHYTGHVRMMGAVQPFISGAISKCVVGDTLLPTADGLVRIGSLHDGEAPDTFRDEILEIASLGGSQKTSAFYYGGHRPVRSVHLRSGHHVTGTPNHRVLVATEQGLDWRRLDEVAEGDLVAVQYGAELWSLFPARLDGFRPSPAYGNQRAIVLPEEMTEDLAFLLGAFASEGCITPSNWTIRITNSVPAVRRRVVEAWRTVFGIEAREVDDGIRCPDVVVSSKTVVEFFDHLGCGHGAAQKRIPDVVLRSPRHMVLAFLDGLSLDAYVTVSTAPKWAICVDSPGLLDDLQAVLTNLGIRHSRVSKWNSQYEKSYDEVYATGRHAQELCRLVPFLEPDKAARAATLLEREFQSDGTADVVPVEPAALHALLPHGTSGRASTGRIRSDFSFLLDPRTTHVTRRTLERVAAAGARLPAWLQSMLDDDLHLSPVVSVVDGGVREVYDVAVPANQAFVGNGIVNHNTVNMPEDATIEEVEALHFLSWQLGLKAVAIYRDNCKVGQPLSTAKKDDPTLAATATAPQIVERIVEKLVHAPVRQKLPRTRTSKTFEFRVADCKGFATIGEYADGRPGEIFLTVSKQGSTLSGIMDAFAKAISYGLQYGVPLRAFVEAFTNMRFEPAGMTDDPDIRFASSIMDYLFRRLALEYLTYEERAELSIFSIDERMQPTLPGVEESVTETVQGGEMAPDPKSIPSVSELEVQMQLESSPLAAPEPPAVAASDAPLCMQCGVHMQRAGSCYACPSCGSTSGCS